jgi:hypothetical protein
MIVPGDGAARNTAGGDAVLLASVPKIHGQAVVRPALTTKTPWGPLSSPGRFYVLHQETKGLKIACVLELFLGACYSIPQGRPPVT